MNFPVFDKMYKCISNYDLYLMPKGIYKTRDIVVDNYLYPMYFIKYDSYYLVSTSVFGLIKHKGTFNRNPNFQTTDFFRPTFQTIDKDIMRARTEYRRSTNEYSDPIMIADMAAGLMQEYITKIEKKFPDHAHILMMGGKDSQNIILTERKSKWIVISGDPNADINKKFISDNNVEIEDFIAVSNNSDDTMIVKEIIASDCFFDVAHFRYMVKIKQVVSRYHGKAIIWYGSSGDGCFTRNNNHLSKDYYNVHDLHVGMAMGIWHQLGKNIFNCPVLSPYQSPMFLDKLFYRYDPYYVDKYSGDLRVLIGNKLFQKDVIYPDSNPEPMPWSRIYSRNRSIEKYIEQLKIDNVPVKVRYFSSMRVKITEKIIFLLDKYSSKRRTKLSFILFPIRKHMAKYFNFLKVERFNFKEI